MQKVDDEEYEDLVEDLEEAEDSVDTQTRALGGMNANDLQEEGKEAAEEAAKAADVAKKKKQEYDKAVKDSNAARIKLAREVKSKQDANSRQEKARVHMDKWLDFNAPKHVHICLNSKLYLKKIK